MISIKPYLIILLISFINLARVVGQEKVNYSPAYFGPNAFPVPEVSDGKIKQYTQLGFSTDHAFGFGDKTTSLRLDIEVPLLPKYISIKTWLMFYEHFQVSPDVALQRGGDVSNSLTGSSVGDVYVQTTFSVLKEKKYLPNIFVTATLKTASGGNFSKRRFYDTPGYYFDATFSKSFSLQNQILKNIQLVGNIGFLCWEMTNSTQNDAPMYGFNTVLSNDFLYFENQIGGYWGWVNNGDRPLVFRSKLTYNFSFYGVSLQYQYGIKDFPYHQIRIGLLANIPFLTPKYK